PTRPATARGGEAGPMGTRRRARHALSSRYNLTVPHNAIHRMLIVGRWIFWPVRPKYGSDEPTTRGFWARVGRLISHRPRAVRSVTAVLLACASLGLIGFKVGTLTTAQSFRGHPQSVTAEAVLAEHFPAGAGEPVEVIGKAAAAPQQAG